MCIIVFKPKKAKLPSDKTLKECFISNPHGAGYMYRDHGGQIIIHKGFMKFEEFLTSLRANTDRKKTEICIHFRIATHGTIKPINCHPFPITSELQPLHDLNVVCTRALCHNGKLSGYGDAKKDISDSAFFAKMLYPCRTLQQYKTVLNRHSESSRFIVMTGKFTVVNGNFIEDAGCLYSNDTYIPASNNQYVYDDDELNTFWSGVNYTKSKYPVYIRDVPNTTQKQLTTTVLDEKIEKKWYKQIDDYNDDVQEYWEMKRQGYLTTKKQQQHDDGFIDFLNTGGGIP